VFFLNVLLVAVAPFGFLRLHKKYNSKIITKTKAPMTEPVIAPSGDFEEDVALLALAVLLVAEAGTDWVCDEVCDVLAVGGAKRGVMSVVSNENLSSSKSLLPFVVEPKFVTTAVW
jgi:hypothetical protein